MLLPYKKTEKKGYVIEADSNTPLNNPGDWDSYHPFGGRYSRNAGEAGLWMIHLTSIGGSVLTFAGNLEDALENAAAWAADHAPGWLIPEEEMKELEKEAREELGPEATDEEVWEKAQEDMTYTESGWVSYEWGYSYDPHHIPADILLTAAYIGATEDLESRVKSVSDVKDILERIYDSEVSGAKKLVDEMIDNGEVPYFGPEKHWFIDRAESAGLGKLVTWEIDEKLPSTSEFVFLKDGKFHEVKVDAFVSDDELFPEKG